MSPYICTKSYSTVLRIEATLLSSPSPLMKCASYKLKRALNEMTNIKPITQTCHSLSLTTIACFFQGALVALIVSLGVSCWIGIGSILAGIELPTLPHSVDGCPLANSSWRNSTATWPTTSWFSTEHDHTG